MIDQVRKCAHFWDCSETTFTTFFPRWKGLDDDREELDRWFEHGDITANPNIAVCSLDPFGIDN